jgi:hypothetical protein
MKILREKTYLKMIENSIGAKTFNSIFAEVNGSENKHVGFTFDYVSKQVIKHPISKKIENSGEPRKIEKIFRYKF